MKHLQNNQKLSLPELLTQCYLGLLLTAFLLYSGSGGYETIGDTRYRFFFALSGGYCIGMALLQAERVVIGRLKPTAPWHWWKKASAAQRLAAVYLALTLISAALSPHKETWIGMSRREGFWTLAIYGVSFLLVSVYGRAKPWMLGVLGASMTVFCMISLLQFAGRNPLNLYPDGLRWQNANWDYGGAYFGTVGNADASSLLLGMVIPMLGVGVWKGSHKARFLLVLPLTLSVVTLVLCHVAAGYVTLVGGTLLTVPVLLQEKKNRRLAWIAALGLAAAAVAGLYLWEPPAGILWELHEVLHGRIQDNFGSGRIYIWRQVLRRIPEHLWFGTGPDTMAAAAIEGFSYFDPVYDLYIQIQVDLAHNEYLNILYHQGLPALAAYLAALVCTAGSWFRWSRNNVSLAVCGCGVLWYGIQVFFGFSLCLTAPVFWAVWALAERECREMRKERET